MITGFAITNFKNLARLPGEEGKLLPVGPLVAGFLLENLSARATVAAFAAFALSLFTWGSVSDGATAP